MLRYVALIVCLILDAINIFWFSKIFAGAYKLFFGAKTPPKNGAIRNGAGATRNKEIGNNGQFIPAAAGGGSPSKPRRRVEKVFG